MIPAINPIVPPTGTFLCDPEPHIWPNDTNTLYVYGSHDSLGDNAPWGCTYNLHVFSTTDLFKWKDWGVVIYSTGDHDDIPWTDEVFYAPDCAYKNNKWYLYLCFSGKGEEGVATATSPAGKFGNARKTGIGDYIDPAVLVDDDDKAYIYWGQRSPNVARLKPDMLSIDSATIKTNILSTAGGVNWKFVEGSSIRKRKGLYYLIYASRLRHNKPNVLAYGTGTNPMGPFTYGGIIIDNHGSDPSAHNNHGSIIQFHGKWYVFYHRASRNTVRNRRFCIEPITFNEDGSIPEVVMTSQGASGPLDACSRIEAEIACGLSGKAYIETSTDTGIGLGNLQEQISFIENNNYAIYRYIDFENGVDLFSARIACAKNNCKIEIRLDSITGRLITTCPVQNTGSLETWAQTTPVPLSDTITGIHAVYCKFIGGIGNLFNLNWFTFNKVTGVKTTIKNRSIDVIGHATIAIYNLQGKCIAKYKKTGLNKNIDRILKDLPFGIYIKKITRQGRRDVIQKIYKNNIYLGS